MTRRTGLPLAVFLLAVSFSTSADWGNLYETELEASLAYQTATSQLKQAELQLAQIDRFYIPYIAVGTDRQNGSLLRNGAFQPQVLTTDLRFENIAGSDITFTLPIVFGADTAVGLGNPELVVSRKLFEETRASRIKAEASLIRARESLRKAEFDIRIKLASDILDAYHSSRILEANSQNLEVLEYVRSTTKDEQDARALDRRILQARRSNLQAASQFETLNPEIRGNTDALYSEVSEIIRVWLNGMPEPRTPAPEWPEIKAQQLDLVAAEQERAFAFLSYVPNPTFSAGLEYDWVEGVFSWSLSVAFLTEVLDRGERDNDRFRRLLGPTTQKIRLDDLVRSRDQSISSSWTTLEVLEIDKQLEQLDLEDAEDEVSRLAALYEGGFISREEYVVGQIDASVAGLALLEANHDYLKQQLRLLAFYLFQ